MVLSNPEFERLAERYGQHDEVKLIIASHRALHSQVRELQAENGRLVSGGIAYVNKTESELAAAQARITALETSLAYARDAANTGTASQNLLLGRITALEQTVA